MPFSRLVLFVYPLCCLMLPLPLWAETPQARQNSEDPSRPANGDGTVEITGELKQWHKVTLDLDGPFAREYDGEYNPFIDCRMTVRFIHESGAPSYTVPGYFAADGNAAETSATAGTVWRAHFAPDKPGRWDYEVSFATGPGFAVNLTEPGSAYPPFDGARGHCTIVPTDKTGVDFRGKGRLEYVGQRYLRFAGSGEYFLKAGADSPETLLAYADFDGTTARKKSVPLKTWQPHVRDWHDGDPTWQDGKGKGLIGALNYLSAKGCRAFSFLTYNVGGDGDNVWPMIVPKNNQPVDKLRYDCSKLDQWQIVFDHAQSRGLFLHFKTQETENDDWNVGDGKEANPVPAALDRGELGLERKLYYRELVARFGYALALNWNLGEENTQRPDVQRAMVLYLHGIDPYDHPVVLHTYPQRQKAVYYALIGGRSTLDGVSLQNHWSAVHGLTKQWVVESAGRDRPWIVSNDEQGPADQGVPPDPGYAGFDGYAHEKKGKYNLDDIRQKTLWGNLMAGGAGVEYYFGYKLPQNDLLCEDFRSRDRSWDYCRIALEFFDMHKISIAEMHCNDQLVTQRKGDNSRYCLAKPSALYLVYFPNSDDNRLDLRETTGSFEVRWFNPRRGGPLTNGSVPAVTGGARIDLGQPPEDADEDWLAVVRRQR